MSLLYRWLTRLLRRVGPRVTPSGSKLGRGLAGRASAHETLAGWGRVGRDRGRPVVWFHAPSVGEGLQAEAVLDALRARRPEVQTAFTHFSPSAEDLAARVAADVAAYLPWDLPEVVAAALEGLEPDVLVYTKTEAWPVLTEEAHRRGIAVCLVGASLPAGSRRARWPARSFLRPTWERLSLVCANTEEDAAGLIELGAAPAVVRTTGDPGIDSAAARADQADGEAPYLRPFHASPARTVVAGSTWPSDEAVVLPALAAARAVTEGLRVVIAPHEPSGARVSSLVALLAEAGWRPTTLGEVEHAGSLAGHDAVVVDSVGKLAHLYTVGHVAYVGGGFHAAGLHSVLEPAAAGLPVLFGPRHGNARAAADLARAGGAKIASDAEAMGRLLTGWLADEAGRRAAGSRAFDYIDEHRGAAARTAELLETLVP